MQKALKCKRKNSHHQKQPSDSEYGADVRWAKEKKTLECQSFLQRKRRSKKLQRLLGSSHNSNSRGTQGKLYTHRTGKLLPNHTRFFHYPVTQGISEQFRQTFSTHQPIVCINATDRQRELCEFHKSELNFLPAEPSTCELTDHRGQPPVD